MEQIRTGGAFRDVQQSSDLTVPEPLHVVQDDDRTLALTERREAKMEPGSEVGGLAGILPDRRQVLAQRVGIANPPATGRIEGRVRDDPVEPRAEGLAGKKSIEGSKGVKEAILHRILGVLVRRHDRACDRVRPSLVGTHERPERVSIAALRRRDELVFVGRAERACRGGAWGGGHLRRGSVGTGTVRAVRGLCMCANEGEGG
jgi:hypothetical protein